MFNEDKKYFDCYEKLIFILVRFKEFKNGEIFKKYSKLIIDEFIQSRLTATRERGFNFNINNDSYEDAELVDEDLVEDDLERYKDVLFSISQFSRFIPDYCVSLLSK